MSNDKDKNDDDNVGLGCLFLLLLSVPVGCLFVILIGLTIKVIQWIF